MYVYRIYKIIKNNIWNNNCIKVVVISIVIIQLSYIMDNNVTMNNIKHY